MPTPETEFRLPRPKNSQYQNLLRDITQLKVIRKLAVKPHYYNLLLDETRIQSATLRRVLTELEQKNVIVSHFFDPFLSKEDIIRNEITIKPRLEYFILNLSNDHTQEKLKDLRLNSFVNYMIKLKKETNYENTSSLQETDIFYDEYQLKKFMFEHHRCFNTQNKFNQIYGIIRNFDESFYPLRYLDERELAEYYDSHFERLEKLSRLQNQSPNSEKDMKIEMLEHKIKKDILQKREPTLKKNYLRYTKFREKEEKDLHKALDNLKQQGISDYDFLILFSWCSPSFETYLKLWNIIKKYSP